MRYIKDGRNNKVVRVEARDWNLRLALEFEITQWRESLLHLRKKLELKKKNYQVLDNLIDFNFYILQTYFLTYIYPFTLNREVCQFCLHYF